MKQNEIDTLIQQLCMTMWLVRGGILSNPNIKERVVVKSAVADGPGTGVNLTLGPQNLTAFWNLHVEHPARVELDSKKGFMKWFDANGKMLLILQDAKMLDARLEERRQRKMADVSRQRSISKKMEEERRAREQASAHAREEAERPQRRAELLYRLNTQYGRGAIQFISEGEGEESQLLIEMPDGTRFSPFNVGGEWLRINGFGIEVY